MSMTEYIALDLETTGLNPGRDKIIEIGAVHMKNGVCVDTWQRLVNPGIPISEKTVEITGITDEMVSGEPYIEEVLPDFLQFTGELPLVGHLILFDYSFMKKACVQQDLPYEREGVDTLKLSRILFSELEHKNLNYVCAHLGILLEHAHRAADDAAASAAIFETMKKTSEALHAELFLPKKLQFSIKKEKTMTKHQKEYLIHLQKCHRIEGLAKIDHLTRSEASRYTDYILSHYGRPEGEYHD